MSRHQLRVRKREKHRPLIQKYQQKTQLTDFFIETLMLLDEFDSEVGELPEVIPLFSYTSAAEVSPAFHRQHPILARPKQRTRQRI